LNLKKNFYENGFKTISPDLPKFNTDGTITITITYEPSSQQKKILNPCFFNQYEYNSSN
jgi:hypothetical protein